MLNKSGRYQTIQLNLNFREKMCIYICIRWEIIKNAYLWTVELCRILIYFYIFCMSQVFCSEYYFYNHTKKIFKAKK